MIVWFTARKKPAVSCQVPGKTSYEVRCQEEHPQQIDWLSRKPDQDEIDADEGTNTSHCCYGLQKQGGSASDENTSDYGRIRTVMDAIPL